MTLTCATLTTSNIGAMPCVERNIEYDLLRPAARPSAAVVQLEL
ncbi:hypothetical protein Z945_3627 [Sulfitobacter noctilucae]|nr:hypothetical protein Z945_3627 [Sulfitobacter noctilucae]